MPAVYKGIDERQQDHRYVCALEKSQIETDHAAVGDFLWNTPSIQ